MRALIIAMFLLAACSRQSASEKADADLAFLKSQNASAAEICRAERRLADAYRDEHNAEKWKYADATASIDCTVMELDRRS